MPFSPGGLSPTLTAEMGGHGNNFVYVLEESDDEGKVRENMGYSL